MGSFHTITTQGRAGSVTSSPVGRSTSTGAVIVPVSAIGRFSQASVTAAPNDVEESGPGRGGLSRLPGWPVAVVAGARVQEDLGHGGNDLPELLAQRRREALDLVRLHSVPEVHARRHQQGLRADG